MLSLGTTMEPNEKYQHPVFLAAVQTGTAEGIRFVDDDVAPQALAGFLSNAGNLTAS